MKSIKQWILLVAMMIISGTAVAQLTIPGTSVSFQLNSDEWSYLRTFKDKSGANVYYYCYVGEVLLDDAGDTILPFLRIYVRDNYNGDVYELAYERYEQHPYQSLREWTKGDGLPKSGGLGYEAMYTNPSDQQDYHFLMTYFKDHRTIVEFRLETTRETFEDMEVKFKRILSTIR
ncbi:MAG: hypothetical protein K6E96_06425 [Bacteroidales bacterium]|nr:hypothetical protein [Bacteroidales bacterium]